MASSTTSNIEQWYLKAAIIVACSVIGYLVYDAIMSTAAELLQRLLIISPLLLVFLVHLLSTTPNQVSIPVPGSEPDAIYGAGGSPWGIAMLLLLLYFLIMYQPSFNALVFYIFMTIVTLRLVLY